MIRSAAPPAEATVVSVLVTMLERLGVERAFGVSGGAMAALWDALSSSPLFVHHFRHESGAAFAAIEAGFASGRPTVLFTTTGPGLTNALTGILAARGEGARVIVISASTAVPARGRFAIQETSRDTMPSSFYESGRLFHFASMVEDPAQLAGIERKLTAGLARRTAFVAHLAIDAAVQRAPASPVPIESVSATAEAPRGIDACVDALRDGPFALWVGFGARDASAEVRELARRMHAPVMCSPRGKGTFPEDDPLFVGVTGLAGHASVFQALGAFRPRRLLVLGTRMGEPTSFWDPRYVTPRGFVHVDADPDVPGIAYPGSPTISVVGDVGATLRAVLTELAPAGNGAMPALPRPDIVRIERRAEGLVRPEALMDALQDQVLDRSDALVLAESGNSFLWATHRLRFAQPHRYRVSTGVGAMGQAAAGVVGAAVATGTKSVAIVGDGSLLMTNEINSAVQFAAPAVWVVLNDARYGMCAQGMEALGLSADASIPQVDFAAFARAQGAGATRVEHEMQLDAALEEAMTARGPFLVDVRIDPACKAPASLRNKALAGANDPKTFPLGS
ncbi:MAG: thiamine pyrophosphate-dependent enzyme [Candidatus Eisenbacteria bacterium]